jgi:hypothetical protein
VVGGKGPPTPDPEPAGDDFGVAFVGGDRGDLDPGVGFCEVGQRWASESTTGESYRCQAVARARRDGYGGWSASVGLWWWS